MDFEQMLFDIAPASAELMTFAKTLKGGLYLVGRSGWIMRGVENPETRYEHVCKVGLASWYLFHTNEALEIGIGHELPELIGPDYIPGEIAIADKHDIEYQNMLRLREILPKGDFWFETWLKYENKVGIGRTIAELNKMCPAIQAVDYMNVHNGQGLEEFYPSARGKISTPMLVELLDKICLDDVSSYESAYVPYFERLGKLQL